MKKVFALVLALCLVASLCACGSVTVTSTSTTTTTTTDANGNTTTTTTTTATYPEGSCGEAAADGEVHDVTITIVNNTGADMIGFYICQTGETEWGNLFDEGEVLADGETAEEFLTLHYSADALSWDIGFQGPEDEDAIDCGAMDISTLPADGITITFGADEWTAD